MIKKYMCSICKVEKFIGSRKAVREHLRKMHLPSNQIHKKLPDGKIASSSLTEHTLSEEWI